MHGFDHESPSRGREQGNVDSYAATAKTPQQPIWLAAASASGIAVFGAAFVVYLLTLAPDITWAYHSADGGELIAAAVTLGVPHPPGYPLYTLLGKLISFLPIGPLAYRFNLLSAMCMAAASGLLAYTGATLFGKNYCREMQAKEFGLQVKAGSPLWAGTFAGALFAFSSMVWQQSIITEVYALNMLAVCSLLALLLLRAPTTRSAVIAGLLQGVAVTTHLSSLLLLPFTLLTVKPRRWYLLLCGLLLGLLPFCLLPVFASSGSPVVWGEPQTARGWWWVVTAQIYHPNVFGFPLERWPMRLATWLSEPSFLIAVIILVASYLRSQRRAALPIILASTAGLYILYALAYDASDAHVLLLPAFAILILLALFHLPRSTPWLLLLPLALLVINFSGICPSEHGAARALAESVLREAPPNSIVLTSGDHTTFTLWYLQYAEGQRDDLTVIDQDLLAFNWYRKRLSLSNPSLQALDRDDRTMLRQLNEINRPWCELKLEPDRIAYFWCKEPA